MTRVAQCCAWPRVAMQVRQHMCMLLLARAAAPQMRLCQACTALVGEAWRITFATQA